jgi:SecD/SecF fusion protein
VQHSLCWYCRYCINYGYGRRCQRTDLERIKEELRNGKPILQAISLGYDKAYSSILDSNATTFLTGVILYSFGSGGVKGFAVTLMIGIVCSLFTAVLLPD